MTKQVVTLRLFYGQVNYDANGNVTSKNEPVKIIHGSQEWENFLKHLTASGITKVNVEKVIDLETLKNVEDYSDIEKEIERFYKSDEKPLTAEQKQIQELIKEVEALKSTKKEVAPAKQQAGGTKVAEALKSTKKEG